MRLTARSPLRLLGVVDSDPAGRGAAAMLVAQVRPKALERDGRLAVVPDLPVRVCEMCGEVYLDAAVASQLDAIARRMLEGPVDQAVGHYTPAA